MLATFLVTTIKALENLNYAYVSRDIGHYIDCFRNDLVFTSVSDDDTLNWGVDTTGSTLVLPRQYDLKVSMVPDSIEYRALGIAEFICRQDSMGEWYVWQWWDYPDPGEDGWSNIKVLFSK